MKKNKVMLYYCLLVVLLILIGISSFFFNYFYNLRNEDLSLSDVSIREKNQMSYNVKLFDNEFFKSSMEEKNYVLSLVDNLNAYFNYSVSFSSPVEGEYSYYVVGNIVMEQNGEKVKNEIYRSDISKYEANGKVINLSESFDIDVDNVIKNYNDQVANLGINVNAEIEYDVVINYSVFNETIKKSLVNGKTLSYYIPIKDITNITYTDDDIFEHREYSDLNFEDNKIYIVICLEFVGAIIIFILLIVLIVKRVNGQVSVYQEKLDKILSKHDDAIVHLKDLPDLSKYDVLFVERFGDVLDAANNIGTPINYFEVVKKHEATFIVLDKDKAYVYKLTSKNA